MMRMRSFATLCLLLTTAACAARPLGTGTAAGVERSPIGTAIMVEERVVRDVVPAPVGRVMRALVDVYEGIGLEPDWIDVEENIVGRTEIYVRSPFDGERASVFFECGRTVAGQPVVDDSRIKLGVISSVVEADEGSTLATRVEAIAFPPDAREELRRDCTTTGRLEARILERVLLIVQM